MRFILLAGIIYQSGNSIHSKKFGITILKEKIKLIESNISRLVEDNDKF
jgi:hypothetical protein